MKSIVLIISILCLFCECTTDWRKRNRQANYPDPVLDTTTYYQFEDLFDGVDPDIYYKKRGMYFAHSRENVGNNLFYDSVWEQINLNKISLFSLTNFSDTSQHYFLDSLLYFNLEKNKVIANLHSTFSIPKSRHFCLNERESRIFSLSADSLFVIGGFHRSEYALGQTNISLTKKEMEILTLHRSRGNPYLKWDRKLKKHIINDTIFNWGLWRK